MELFVENKEEDNVFKKGKKRERNKREEGTLI